MADRYRNGRASLCDKKSEGSGMGIEVTEKVTELDAFTQKLDQITERAKEIDGTHDVPLTDLFSDPFIQKHTQYGSLRDFLSAAATVFGKSEVVSDDLTTQQFSQFVADHTCFDGWTAMVKQGAAEHFRRKLFS